ncbi:iron ABC transporter substrate-binding protein [Rhodovarius crocodyli]|uniref:Iron ABC transporter substrate-binding protein n=1 Tax=Rhodovarius crocodyli TaxID=1979269 RepID=A0A437LX77_9PROT|nr:ABC transporter substrate-binding protein [Rhodovarius crocodyli]RVT89986.1 iron ABC transporter substrate-binding protein [Rhodovarius crocodyli]
MPHRHRGHRPAALLLAASLAGALPAGAAEFLDQRGVAHRIDRPVERVVTLPMPLPSTYMAIDGTERHVVGMNPSSGAALRDGILARIFPRARAIATDITRGAGFTPNIEAILALRPDAVFQWASQGPELLEVLDRVGLRTIGITCCSQADFAAYTGFMGELSGRQPRAAELLRRQDAVRARLAAATEAIPDARRPRVAYVGRYTDSMRIAGPGTYNDMYLRLAGGRNAATSAPAAVTLEQVLAWDPEVILLGNFDTAMPADVYADPRWAGLAAVRSRRVYRMPLGGYRWDPPSHESALTWIWLAELLQPGASGFDLRAEMREWFRFLYGHELAEDDIDAILFAGPNQGAAGYDRLLRR